MHCVGICVDYLLRPLVPGILPSVVACGVRAWILLGDDFWRVSVFVSCWLDSGYMFSSVPWVQGWYACDNAPRVVFTSLVGMPMMLGIMAGMNQKDSCPRSFTFLSWCGGRSPWSSDHGDSTVAVRQGFFVPVVPVVQLHRCLCSVRQWIHVFVSLLRLWVFLAVLCRARRRQRWYGWFCWVPTHLALCWHCMLCSARLSAGPRFLASRSMWTGSFAPARGDTTGAVLGQGYDVSTLAVETTSRSKMNVSFTFRGGDEALE